MEIKEITPDEDRGLSFVREGGLEPPRPCGHWHLKPARLPFRHSREQILTLSRARDERTLTP